MLVDPDSGEPIGGSRRRGTRSGRGKISAGMNYGRRSVLSTVFSYVLGGLGILAMARLFRANWQRRIIQIGMLCFIPAMFIAPSPWNIVIALVGIVWSLGFVRLQAVLRQYPERLRLLTAFMACNGYALLGLGLLGAWTPLNILYAQGATLLLAIVMVVGRRDGGW